MLSRTEAEFLRAAAWKRIGGERSSARPALIEVLRSVLAAQEEMLLVPVSLFEIEWLDRVAQQNYGFITREERRARLVLREKLRSMIDGSGPGEASGSGHQVR